MYIVIKDTLVLTCLSYEPDAKDLACRGEILVVSEDKVLPGYSYVGGVFTAPVVAQNTGTTKVVVMSSLKSVRDTLLDNTSYIFQRQLTGSATQKLSDADYQLWVTYWQELRDLPSVVDLSNVVWPTPPTTK